MELSAGFRANSGCLGGNAFLCDNFQPVPVADDLSYGFAIQVSDTQVGDNPNCCKCYEVQWLSGGAQDKKMIVQILTPGGSGGDMKKNDLIFLVPGGEQGPLKTKNPTQKSNNFNWYVSHSSQSSSSGPRSPRGLFVFVLFCLIVLGVSGETETVVFCFVLL